MTAPAEPLTRPAVPPPEPLTCSPSEAEPLIRVEGLTVEYRDGENWTGAVTDVSFVIHRGETLGLAGESGCATALEVYIS